MNFEEMLLGRRSTAVARVPVVAKGRSRQWISTMSLAALIAAVFASCSGGGGGDGDSPAGRTSTTGIRIIHASVDESPITVFIDEVAVQTKSYLESADFVRVQPGTRTFSARRANSVSENILSISQPFNEDMEYTVFVWGEAIKGDRRVSLLPEAIVRPDSGNARFRFANGYSGDDRYRLRCGSESSALIRQGNVTEYVVITASLLDCEILSSGGSRAASISFTPPDRSDVTVVFAGSDDLNVSFTRLYNDLD